MIPDCRFLRTTEADEGKKTEGCVGLDSKKQDDRQGRCTTYVLPRTSRANRSREQGGWGLPDSLGILFFLS